VITPGDVADGDVPVEPADWPMVAAQWLADGFDSEELRQLAGVPAREAAALRPTRMRAVLRSISVPIPADEELEQRCDRALAAVRRDLDATGWGRFEVHTVCSDDWSKDVRPSFRVALAEGWDVNADILDPTAPFIDLVCQAGNAVVETIVEIWFLAWPDCRDHNGPQLAARRRASTEPNTSEPWWWCVRGDHFVARVGQLRAEHVRPLPERLS
jgi:hypothetical protein